MRLVRLRVARFGPIRERVLEFDDEAVVVFGRNESGKSSFRSAIETERDKLLRIAAIQHRSRKA